MTPAKRQRERKREEQLKEKEERKRKRRQESENKVGAEAGVDPDIAGIIPGPQPLPEEDAVV